MDSDRINEFLLVLDGRADVDMSDADGERTVALSTTGLDLS